MIPSPELRITSIVNSLENVIIPAIADDNPLALEQCQLIIAQLTMLSDQIPYVSRYHEACLNDVVSLAKALASTQGGPQTEKAARYLINATEDASAAVSSYDAFHMVGNALEGLIHAVQIDASQEDRERLERDVLAFTFRQTERERTWFKQSGLDHNPEELKSIAELFC